MIARLVATLLLAASLGLLPQASAEAQTMVPTSPDAGATRLLFAPTGRSLPRGTGYAGVYSVIAPFMQVGITDRISIGAGTPLLFWGGGEPPFWFTPKVQVVARERVQAAVGAIQFVNVADETFGLAYGVATYGRRSSAVTVGGGYGYALGDGGSGRTSVVILGGEHRVSPRTTLMGEAWLLGGHVGWASVAVRLHGRRVATDLGLLAPLGGDSMAFAPVVNVAWGF